MQIGEFSTIADEFLTLVHTQVWCNVATTDSLQRSRSRVLHPIWELGGKSVVGWIATGRSTLKAKHLANNPHMSVCYMKDPFQPIYIDCVGVWVDERTEKQRIFDLFCDAPPPLGYDPSQFRWTVDNPDSGLLKMIPWRVELANLFGETRVWQG